MIFMSNRETRRKSPAELKKRSFKEAIIKLKLVVLTSNSVIVFSFLIKKNFKKVTKLSFLYKIFFIH